jgi:hypothetical protein
MRRSIHLFVGSHAAEAPISGVWLTRHDLEPCERHCRLLADGWSALERDDVRCSAE